MVQALFCGWRELIGEPVTPAKAYNRATHRFSVSKANTNPAARITPIASILASITRT